MYTKITNKSIKPTKLFTFVRMDKETKKSENSNKTLNCEKKARLSHDIKQKNEAISKNLVVKK